MKIDYVIMFVSGGIGSMMQMKLQWKYSLCQQSSGQQQTDAMVTTNESRPD